MEAEVNTMASHVHDFDINRKSLIAYRRTRIGFVLLLQLPVLALAVLMSNFELLTTGTAPILVCVLFTTLILLVFPGVSVSALNYRIEDSTLRIDSGLLLLKRNSIPLNSISNVEIKQGFLMRCFDLWDLEIRTNDGRRKSASHLIGLAEPENVRDQILAA